jgi:hypothetical protein
MDYTRGYVYIHNDEPMVYIGFGNLVNKFGYIHETNRCSDTEVKRQFEVGDKVKLVTDPNERIYTIVDFNTLFTPNKPLRINEAYPSECCTRVKDLNVGWVSPLNLTLVQPATQELKDGDTLKYGNWMISVGRNRMVVGINNIEGHTNSVEFADMSNGYIYINTDKGDRKTIYSNGDYIES